MPVPTALNVPNGDNESLGIGKETQFGQFVIPTMWHAFTSFLPKPINNLVQRTGARQHYGQVRPVTAGYESTAALDVEPDPDTLGQLIAFSLGAQSTPTLVGAGAQTVNTTTTTATTIGAGTVITPSSMKYIAIGMSLTIDTSTQMETVTVTDTSATTFSCTTTKTHAAAVTITGSSLISATAYTSTMKFGLLPSFSAQLNRVTDGVNYLGCLVDSYTISMAAKTGMKASFSLVNQNEQITSSLTSPTFSTKLPLIFEHPDNAYQFGGAYLGDIGQVPVISWSISGANNLMKSYFSFGSGRLVQSFPQMQRKITGTVTLAFASNAQYKAFLGSSLGPARVTVPGVSMNMVCVGSELIDAVNPFSFNFILPSCILSSHEVMNTSNTSLNQTFNFESAESASGANDDLSCVYVGTSSTIF
jgi:hypothetical protein